MLERDYSQKHPTREETAAIMSPLSISYEESQNEAVDALLDALRYVYANGDARFASFLIGASTALDYFAVRDQLDGFQFWTQMLQSPAVLEKLPWLNGIYIAKAENAFRPLSAYFLDGDLAETLMKGGAYRRFPGTAEEAKTLGLDFCAAVFENRYDELILRKSTKAWADWFFMVGPWNNTWLGLDRRARRFWILCTTDTD